MTPKEQLIERLRALCARSGGPVAVADAAGVSPENLQQILSGVKLPSGEPRGVGPTVAKKLQAAFPGWSEPPEASGEPAGMVSIKPATVADVVDLLAEHLESLSDDNRAAAADQLRTLVHAPDSPKAKAALVRTLGGVPAETLRTKRYGT